MKKVLLMFAVILLLVMTTGCADVAQCVTSNPDYGFWNGLWHGLVAGFSFIGSLFDDGIAVYAVNNNGAWYDFGFVFGIGALGSFVKIILGIITD